MSYFYNTFIFNPLYNGLVALFNTSPWIDAGIAVIVLTVIVRLILFPISKKSIVTQIRMKEIAPELEEIKEKYKNDTEEQARRTLALYKDKKVNPFSSFFLLLLQLPIIWALYHIFLKAGLPNVNTELLYSFVKVPSIISIEFLGRFDITQKSVVLALLAALSTFFQLRMALNNNKLPENKGNNSFGADLAKNMQNQMKYIFPIIVFFISYKISGVIALYWLTSNLFTIGQEIFVRRKLTQA